MNALEKIYGLMEGSISNLEIAKEQLEEVIKLSSELYRNEHGRVQVASIPLKNIMSKTDQMIREINHFKTSNAYRMFLKELGELEVPGFLEDKQANDCVEEIEIEELPHVQELLNEKDIPF